MRASAWRGGHLTRERVERLFHRARDVLREPGARSGPLGDHGSKPLLAKKLDAAPGRSDLGRRRVAREPEEEARAAKPGGVRLRTGIERSSYRADACERARCVAGGGREGLRAAPPHTHKEHRKLLVSGLPARSVHGRVDRLCGTVRRAPAEPLLRRAAGPARSRDEEMVRQRDVRKRPAYGEGIGLLVVEEEENREGAVLRQKEHAFLHGRRVAGGAVFRRSRDDRGELRLATKGREIGILLERDAIVEPRGNGLVEPGEGLIDASGARVEAGEVVGGRRQLAELPRALEEDARAVELVRVHRGEAEALELEGVGRRAFENAHVLDFRLGAPLRGGAARRDLEPGRRGRRGLSRRLARLRARGERNEDGGCERGEKSLHPVDCTGSRVRTGGAVSRQVRADRGRASRGAGPKGRAGHTGTRASSRESDRRPPGWASAS